MKFTNWLPFGKVPEISASDLAKELDSWKIVDVRTVAEFENGHIEGAVNPVSYTHLTLPTNREV